MNPPIAKKRPVSRIVHGVNLHDDYAWLAEKDNPETIAYLEAENRYTQSQSAHLRDFREKLYAEMLGRIKEDDTSVPYFKSGFWYYTRTETGKAYPIHCRKKGNLEAVEEVLLDENVLAEGHDFFDLGDLDICPDDSLMAYTIDTEGDEKYALFVKDLRTGKVTKEAIEDIYPEIEWVNDNKTIFYIVLDENTHRAHQMYRYEVGSGQTIGTLVFEEPDEAYFLNLYKTKDEKYFFLYVGSNVTTEMYYFSADDPFAEPILFHERKYKVEFGVEHHEGWFYFYTNENALNFKLVRTRMEELGPEHWEEVLPHDPQVKIDSLDVFKDHLVVYLRRKGKTEIYVRQLSTGQSYDIPFDEPVYTVGHSANLEFDTAVLRFNYSSLAFPIAVYDFDMVSQERILLKQQPVLGDFDPKNYATERTYATSPDGTQVPISIVYRKNLRKAGPQATFLYAYGSYGVTVEPYFRSTRLSLLDRGMIFAIAHIRGGGAMGRGWYEDGKFLKKKNTFDDFIAASEHLIAEGYTEPSQLAAAGGSAGGMLMGAVLNMRPDLYKVVEAHVPFVDVVNTMLDPTLPLTVPEYDEWGNPEEEAFFHYMLSYSPYDNVKAQDYPDILITAGLNDPRVHYWEPAKWCAKLRDLKTNDNLLLLKTNMDAGHQGASGRYGHLKETAFEYAFTLDRLGLIEK